MNWNTRNPADLIALWQLNTQSEALEVTRGELLLMPSTPPPVLVDNEKYVNLFTSCKTRMEETTHRCRSELPGTSIVQ
jgi:hypothetical protein